MLERKSLSKEVQLDLFSSIELVLPQSEQPFVREPEMCGERWLNNGSPWMDSRVRDDSRRTI